MTHLVMIKNASGGKTSNLYIKMEYVLEQMEKLSRLCNPKLAKNSKPGLAHGVVIRYFVSLHKAKYYRLSH